MSSIRIRTRTFGTAYVANVYLGLEPIGYGCGRSCKDAVLDARRNTQMHRESRHEAERERVMREHLQALHEQHMEQRARDGADSVIEGLRRFAAAVRGQ